MNFGAALRQTYAGAWGFLVAIPILAAAVIGVEGLQHVVEWRTGFYASFAGMKAAGHDPARMIAGSLKVGWILVLGYWTARFIVTRSPKHTVAFDRIAVRRYAAVFLLSASLGLLTIFGGDLFHLAGVDRRIAATGMMIFTIATFPISLILVPWAVGAALGDPRATLRSSFRRAWGSIFWGLGLTILAPLPLMAAHYALGYGAVGRAPWLAISMLTIDALLVAFLGVVINVCQVVLAERMAERAGETLSISPA
jgi:hypothetical protein